ncbi:guanine nucleotide-binding protein G(s) subunit alpha isoforms XLas-like isoform X1 [Helicoverpa armigera]|uniref:guanine nucleotide-binding protein G(s) subunit alpha isoforms XLas-like isoform X1 n=1 Tax=Helicoverpa armigera TaxID=29058 RepID=UPI003082B87F
MPGRRKVSLRQMELLLEFAHSHRDIALGRFPPGPQGVRDTREAWRSISVALNCVGSGATKTPDQWRRYWIEFKAKTKGKAADMRRSTSATGGGPNRLVPLNYIEEKVLALLGPVVVEGLPGVRLPIDILSLGDPPTSQPSMSGAVAVHTSQPPVPPKPSTSTYDEQIMEVEWLDDSLLEETQPVEQMPAAEAVEQTPAAEAVEQTPAAEAVEQTPAAEAVEQTPAAEAVEQTPAAEAVEQTPAAEAVEQTPAAEAVEQTPAAGAVEPTLSSEAAISKYFLINK